jgi:hypothetical protein
MYYYGRIAPSVQSRPGHRTQASRTHSWQQIDRGLTPPSSARDAPVQFVTAARMRQKIRCDRRRRGSPARLRRLHTAMLPPIAGPSFLWEYGGNSKDGPDGDQCKSRQRALAAQRYSRCVSKASTLSYCSYYGPWRNQWFRKTSNFSLSAEIGLSTLAVPA